MSTITTMYQARTPGSAQLAERARTILPSGIVHDSRQLSPYPLYIQRASGAHKWDVDGHRYIDYAGGHGALLLGHNPPEVVAAITAQLANGTHYGACHELEVQWAELIRQLKPACQRVRFTSSGTEATLLALRLARAFTGKPKIVRFLGHFHGWHDHMAFGVSNHEDGSPSPGILPELAKQILLCPPNDAVALEKLLTEHTDIAAVIFEPTGGSWGKVPTTSDFPAQVRALTTKHNVLLIFDEVISGFRCSPGGAQAVYGIEPDLTTLAKIVAGGLPGGAVGGRADIMDLLAFAPNREKVPHQGTYNANPVAAAAGIATLQIIASSDACQKANDYAARLRPALQAAVDASALPWCIYGTFSGFHIFTNPQKLPVRPADLEAGQLTYAQLKQGQPARLLNQLRLAMNLFDVDLFSWVGGPTSAVHSDDDLERTVAAFQNSLQMLRATGEL